jgi:tetratricopeptide (TPR) repeat protein
MLLDRGLLVADGPAYTLTGPVEALEVPETLHALIAARLDGLSAEERRLLQDTSVLGKTFTKDAVAALAGTGAEVEPLLTGLVRKEVLGVQADPRSPEHGQYGFLQDLVRHVAYETLSKRERRAKHLAAAEYLSRAFAADEDEVVEVIASHYLAADEAVPDSEDAADIRGKAQGMLVRAGDRAESLAASAEARRYYEQAANLVDDPSQRAELLNRAAEMAARTGDPSSAQALYEEAIAVYESQGATHAAARVHFRLGRLEARTGRRNESLTRLERAFSVISEDEPDEDLALLAASLASGYWATGDLQRASERAELALDVAEAHAYPAALTLALRAKSAVAGSRGHYQEGQALQEHSLRLALEHDLLEDAAISYFILSDRCFHSDEYARALDYLDDALTMTQRLGNRPQEWAVLAERTHPLTMLGRWEEAMEVIENFGEDRIGSGGLFLSLLQSAVDIHVQRGQLDEARRIHALFGSFGDTTDNQELGVYHGTRAQIRRAEGKLAEAMDDAQRTLEVSKTIGIQSQSAKQGFVEGVEAAFARGDTARVEELLELVESVPQGTRPPYLDAHARRARARLEGDAGKFDAAAERFRDLGILFWLAVTLLEHSELTGDEESRAEAREIFERLEATPWLERASAAEAVTA